MAGKRRLLEKKDIKVMARVLVILLLIVVGFSWLNRKEPTIIVSGVTLEEIR